MNASVAVVFVGNGPSAPPFPEAHQAILSRMPASVQWRYLSHDPAQGIPDAGASPVAPIHLADLDLPSPSAFAHAYTFDRQACALNPWIAEHLFNQGVEFVLCLDSTCWTSLACADAPTSAIEDWLAALDASTDLCLSPLQWSMGLRHTPETRAFLNTQREQRVAHSQHALATGQLVLGFAHTPMSGALRDRTVVRCDGAAAAEMNAWHASGASDVLLGEVPAVHDAKDIRNLHRLQRLYDTVLQQRPSAANVLAYGPRMASGWGWLRLAAGLMKNRSAVRAATSRRPQATETAALAKHQGASHRRPRLTAEGLFAADDASPAGINLMGYVRAELGLGEAARSMAMACEAARVDFSVVDLGYQTLHPQADYPILEQARERRYAIDMHYVNASHAQQTAAYLSDAGVGRNLYTIGFWHWEQPVFPEALRPAFEHVDEVWVPSTFVADAIGAVSPVPVFKVPHAVACEPSAQLSRETFGLPSDKLLVLVMYDLLSYQHRKNPEAAIEAFRLAARTNRELGLIIKTINGERHAADLARLKASVSDLPHVFFVDAFLSRQATWDLQACSDILLSLHRAEGFGLAPAEMMRLGKPVVATGWSANMDFMTTDNSMPVRFELKPLMHDVGAYPAGPLWAEADIEHAAWCLDKLARDHAMRVHMGQLASQSIRQQLAPATVGQQIKQRLQVLGRWRPELNRPPQKGSPMASQCISSKM